MMATRSSGRFDPRRLTGEASLQRVVMATLRGVPSDIVGRPASDVCSRDTLARLVVESGSLPAPEPGRLSDQLGELRSSPDPATRDAAGRVLRAHGARLGALLATLKHPETPAEQGTTPARRAYLEYWLDMQRVWLGGGLLASGSRVDIVEGAERLLAGTGTVLDLRIAPSPPVLPLLGAARSADPRDGRAVVVDAGHSTIKSAVAVIEGGALTALEMRPARPAPWDRRPAAVEAALVAAIVEAVGSLGTGPARRRRVAVSVASYVNGEGPVDDGRSIYGGLTAGRLRHALAARTGDDISIEFLHDGSAAAFGTADPSVSAVVTLGTWLGIGFTPAGCALLPGDPVVA